MLEHVRGDVGLQIDRAKVIADQPADRALGLFLVAGDRSREVGREVGYRSDLPFAELLGCRQVDIDEVRVAAIEVERSRT